MISDRIREARTAAKMSMRQLARAVSTEDSKVFPTQIHRWESGTGDPSTEHLARLAQALGRTTDWLLQDHMAAASTDAA